MQAGEIVTTVVGNLADDPELRFTPSGAAVAKFRVASTPRIMNRDKGEWQDGETTWVPVTAWRKLAENVAESLRRGTRVVVYGTIVARTYETKEGEKRTVWEMTAQAVGPDLTYATAKVERNAKEGARKGTSASDDTWGSASKERPAASAETQRAKQDQEEEPPW